MTDHATSTNGAVARANAYASQVEQELSDLEPQERFTLLAGLVDHLLEPGEHREFLVDELPPPADYAKELRDETTRTEVTGGETTSWTRRPLAWLAVGIAALIAVLILLPWAAGLFVNAMQSPGSPGPTPIYDSAYDGVTVPDVRGLTETDAVAALEAVGLRAIIHSVPSSADLGQGVTSTAPGAVADQEPLPATLIEDSSAVTLTVIDDTP